MKKILLSIFLIGFLFLLNDIYAFELDDTVSISLSSVFDNENSITNEISLNFGDVIEVEPSNTNGYDFAFWVVNGIVRSDLPLSHQFKATTDLELIAIFNKPNERVAVFIDSNGKVIDYEYVLTGESVVPPSHIGYTKPGMSVDLSAPWKNHHGSTTYTINDNSIYKLQYVVNISTHFLITVNNGIGAGEYAYNQVVTVSSTDEDFAYWTEDGVIISYDSTFSFTALKNRELTAVIGEHVKQPVISLQNVTGIREDHESFLGQVYLPEGYELLTYGFLTSEDDKVLTLSATNTNIIQSTTYHPLTKEFLRSFSAGQTTDTVRAYMVVLGPNGLETIYSAFNFGVSVFEVTVDDVSQSVLSGQKAVEPLQPTRDGYRFDGWEVEGETFDFNTPIQSDLVITSKWSENINQVTGQISDLYGNIDNVEVRLGEQVVYTDLDGNFTLNNIPVGTYEIQFEKDGYELKRIVVKASDFDDLVSVALGQIELEFTYGQLGQVGGNNTVLWDGYFTRNKTELIFKFVTVNPTTANGNHGMGIFLSTTNNAGTSRSADEILFGFYLGGSITVANYPNNVKTGITSGFQNLPMGIRSNVVVTDELVELYAYIPYAALNQMRDETSYDAYRAYGISLTADNLNNNTWDIWNRPDLLGVNNAPVVERANPRDYLRMGPQNELYNAINNYNTFIYGYTEPGTLVELGLQQTTSAASGYYQFTYQRENDDEVQLVFTKAYYETETENISFESLKHGYQLNVVLEPIQINLEIKVTDSDGEPLENVKVTYLGDAYYTDELGQLIIENIELFNAVVLEFEKDGFLIFERTIAVEDLETGDLIEVQLYLDAVEITYAGNIYDVNGPVVGATVIIEELSISTTTDLNGDYVFNDIVIGDYTLIVETLDYETQVTQALMSTVISNVVETDMEIVQNAAVLGEFGTRDKAVTMWDGYLTRTTEYAKFTFVTSDSIVIGSGSTEILDLFLHIEFPTTYIRTDYTFNFAVRGDNTIFVYNYPNDGKTTISTFSGDIASGVTSTWVTESGVTTATVYVYWSYYQTVDAKYTQTATSDIWLAMNTVRGSSYHWWNREDLPGIYVGSDSSVNRNIPIDYVSINAYNEVSVIEENYNMDLFAQIANEKLTPDIPFSVDTLAKASATSIQTLATGLQVFSDRAQYIFNAGGVKALFGLDYTYAPIGGGQTTITTSGYVIIAAPYAASGNYATLNTTLVGAGWTLILSRQRSDGDVKMAVSLNDQTNYYVKWVETGTTIAYGQWHVAFYKNS